MKVLGLFFTLWLISIFPTAIRGQELFDSYGTVSVTEERARLDNFALSLKQNRKHLGYIVVQAPKRNMRAAANRALRARDYLVRKRKIARERIITVKSDRQMEKVEFILQPVPPDAEVPKDWIRFE